MHTYNNMSTITIEQKNRCYVWFGTQLLNFFLAVGTYTLQFLSIDQWPYENIVICSHSRDGNMNDSEYNLFFIEMYFISRSGAAVSF